MSIRFTLRVNAVLAFDTSAIPAPASAYTYTAGTAITPLTLPPAIGGAGTLTYTLTPTASIPDGLTFDAGALTLTGTPNMATTADLTYAVTDATGVTLEQTFMVTVSGALTIPDTIEGQAYTVSQPVLLTLPEAAGGAAPLTYMLTRTNGFPVLARGLTFNEDARPPTISGAPEEELAFLTIDARMRYTVTDANGAEAFTEFNMRVAPLPTFDTNNIPEPAYTYTAGTPITPLTLPLATGGIGGASLLRYTLTPTASIPPELTFDATARILSGTPTTVTGPVTLTYAVTDVRDVTVSLTFTVAVTPGPVLTMMDVVVNEGAGMATVRVMLDKAAGGSFMVDAFTSDISATAGTDYTAVISRRLTFDGNAGEIETFSVTIVDDALAEGDEDVRLSLGNLEPAVRSVTSSTATLTITDDDSGLTVESVGYFADEAVTIPITEAAIGTHLYMVIQFSENLQTRLTAFSPMIVSGRPGILVLAADPFGDPAALYRHSIIAHGTAFTPSVGLCRPQFAGDTSAWLCQVPLTPGFFATGKLRANVLTAETLGTSGNRLAADYVDEGDGIDVVTTPDAPMVTSITHYSGADPATATVITPTDTVTGGPIYSVVQFAGLIIASPEIFYQIGAVAADRMLFDVHATGGTPQNGTCALIDGDYSMAVADPSFLCRYNTRASDTGTTYQVIVGTGTTDTAGQPLNRRIPQ